MKRIACIGEAMIELFDAGNGLMRRSTGGDTMNVAVYARRNLPTSVGSVAYVTALGDDTFSQGMIDGWAEEGMDTGLVLRLPGRLPGIYAITVDERGERSFHYWRSASAARDLVRSPAFDGIAGSLAGFDVIYLSGITLAILDQGSRRRLLEVLESARAAGHTVAFDPNWRPRLWPDPATARSAILEALRFANWAFPTFDDEFDLFGDPSAEATADRLHAMGVEEVVVKRGPEPALVSTVDGRDWVAGERVARPVDTTAAGDSFNGAYMAARLAGQPPVDAAARGHAQAARVIMVPGAIVPRTV